MRYLEGFDIKLEKENYGKREESCVYHRDRGRGRWISSCGLDVAYLGRDFIYCPKCGKIIKRAI